MLSRLGRYLGCLGTGSAPKTGRGEPYKAQADGQQARGQTQQEAASVFELAFQVLKAKTEQLLANDQSLLSQEYNSLLECDVLETVEAAEHTNNAGKNRYVNVLPFDYNRVKISGEDGQDYINASLVQVRFTALAEVDGHAITDSTPCRVRPKSRVVGATSRPRGPSHQRWMISGKWCSKTTVPY